MIKSQLLYQLSYRGVGGIIYLRGRVAGKPIRVSLETSDLRIAVIKRDSRLNAMREAVAREDLPQKRSLGAFIDLVEQRITLPHLKSVKVWERWKFITTSA